MPAATTASCGIAHLFAGPAMTILHGTPFWSESGMHGAVQCVREGTSTWGCAQSGALQAHAHCIVAAGLKMPVVTTLCSVWWALSPVHAEDMPGTQSHVLVFVSLDTHRAAAIGIQDGVVSSKPERPVLPCDSLCCIPIVACVWCL